MRYKINHRTTYTYSSEVAVGDHVACLRPRSFGSNELLSNVLLIAPTPAVVTERTDYFGNALSFFTVQEPHRTLVVESRSEVLVQPKSAAAGGKRDAPVEEVGEAEPGVSPAWEASTAELAAGHVPEELEACQFRFASPRIRLRAELAAYAQMSFTPGRPMREALLDFNTRIYRDFKFDSKVTNVRTPTEEVFAKRHGVCQDFAHVGIACLRSIGLAARYVSGYLRTYPPPGRPRLVGADASHAWLSVYCRGVGWMDVDPTNNVAPTDGHVTVAWGRDYGDVSPLRGLILGGGGHDLKVEVDMEPIEA